MSSNYVVKDYSIADKHDSKTPFVRFWEDYYLSATNEKNGGYPLPEANNQYVSDLSISPITDSKLITKITLKQYFKDAKPLKQFLPLFKYHRILSISPPSSNIMFACALDFSQSVSAKPGTMVRLYYFNFWDAKSGLPTAAVSPKIAQEMFQEDYIQPINDTVEALHNYYNKSSTSNTPKGLTHKYIKYL